MYLNLILQVPPSDLDRLAGVSADLVLVRHTSMLVEGGKLASGAVGAEVEILAGRLVSKGIEEDGLPFVVVRVEVKVIFRGAASQEVPVFACPPVRLPAS